MAYWNFSDSFQYEWTPLYESASPSYWSLRASFPQQGQHSYVFQSVEGPQQNQFVDEQSEVYPISEAEWFEQYIQTHQQEQVEQQQEFFQGQDFMQYHVTQQIHPDPRYWQLPIGFGVAQESQRGFLSSFVDVGGQITWPSVEDSLTPQNYENKQVSVASPPHQTSRACNTQQPPGDGQWRNKKTPGYPKRQHNSVTGPLSTSEAPVTPLIDSEGRTWLRFRYKEDGEIKEESLLVDVASIRADNMPNEWKDMQAVYPRTFQGLSTKRTRYESAVNELGWALVMLNPQIEGRRGLVQQAVNHYRNNGPDLSLRSRRTTRAANKARKARKKEARRRVTAAAADNAGTTAVRLPQDDDGAPNFLESAASGQYALSYI